MSKETKVTLLMLPLPVVFVVLLLEIFGFKATLFLIALFITLALFRYGMELLEEEEQL